MLCNKRKLPEEIGFASHSRFHLMLKEENKMLLNTDSSSKEEPAMGFICGVIVLICTLRLLIWLQDVL